MSDSKDWIRDILYDTYFPTHHGQELSKKAAEKIRTELYKRLPKEKKEEYGLDLCKSVANVMHGDKEEYCSVCHGIFIGYNQALKDIKEAI